MLVAGHPDVLARKDFISALFDPFGKVPQPLDDPAELLEPGPPLYTTHPDVPRDQILMDTPDFDTGTEDRYTNRDIAREVLEACNVLIYIVTNTTYNNLENTRFMRQVLTETGMRRCILVYSCSRTLTDSQVMDHLSTTAANLYGATRDDYLIGTYRTDTSDAVAAGNEFMNLRPIRPRDPAIMDLLAQLDPRGIREQQIQTMLTALVKHVRQVVATAKTVRDEIDLYGGVLQLALAHAVQQSLVSFPLKKIMLRMNDIWLETSPSHLKFFRGVGSVIGKPARMIFSMVRMAKGGDSDAIERKAGAVDTLELIESNLLAGASELRDKILAEEVIAETIAKDPEGRRLSALVDQIRQQRGRDQKELPSRHISARHRDRCSPRGGAGLHARYPQRGRRPSLVGDGRTNSRHRSRDSEHRRRCNAQPGVDRSGQQLSAADELSPENAGIIFRIFECSAGNPWGCLHTDHR